MGKGNGQVGRSIGLGENVGLHSRLDTKARRGEGSWFLSLRRARARVWEGRIAVLGGR